VRKRTVAALTAFVVISAGIHFVIGPAMTAISPHWDYSILPKQALSIVTLSRRQQPEATPKPTPPPTPPPIPLPKTNRNLALLKYREMGLDVKMRAALRTPARRLSTIVLEHHAPVQPHEQSPEGNVVVAMPEPTPETPTTGSSRAATASNGDLLGSTVWGDDNPPRPIKRAPLAIADNATGTALVEVDVDPSGVVVTVRLVRSSGDASVDQAALDAARNSTFAPATLNGMPIHGTCTLEYAPPGAPTT
jgi:TonB family protein